MSAFTLSPKESPAMTKLRCCITEKVAAAKKRSASAFAEKVAVNMAQLRKAMA